MKRKPNIKLYGALFIIMLLAVGGLFYVALHPSKLKPATITSISEVKYGSIANGKLVGAKFVIAGTANPTDDTILIKTKGTELKFGDYVIKPQKNVAIKLKSQNPYATATMQQYPVSYYQPAFSSVLQLSALAGEPSWTYHTPMTVNIYSDGSDYPNTLVISKYLNEIGVTSTDVGSGVTVAQVSIAFLGPSDLPRPNNIVVATSPNIDGIMKVAPDYKSQTYIFDKNSFDSKANYFYSNYGSRTLFYLNEPVATLWSGFDRYSVIGFGDVSCSGITGYAISKDGFCKLTTWNGLYKEVARPAYDLSYDPATNSIKANGIQYSANYLIELPSELVDSLAILRGVGMVEILSVDVPDTVRNDNNYKSMTATVRNNGDLDGFNIQPISKSGKLIFTPNSYTSYQIGAGEQVPFQFSISVAGKETAGVSAKEDVCIEARAVHGNKVIKDVTIGIEYGAQPPGQPTVVPKSTSTLKKTTTGEAKAWYENPVTWILAALFTAMGYFIYSDYKKGKKK